MAKKLGEYKSYLLRLWRSGEERAAWHASLEDSHSGARQGFATLEHLFAFLAEQTGEQHPSSLSSPSDATATPDESKHE